MQDTVNENGPDGNGTLNLSEYLSIFGNNMKEKRLSDRDVPRCSTWTAAASSRRPSCAR